MLSVGIHGGAELKSGFLRFMLVSDSNSVIDDFSKHLRSSGLDW